MLHCETRLSMPIFLGQFAPNRFDRAMRARLSSRPSTASTSKTPGEVLLPVSAARSGWATAPSFWPPAGAKSRIAASAAAAVQSPETVQSRLGAAQDLAGIVIEQQRPPCRRSAAAASANRKAAPSTSSTSVLARSFRPGRAASNCALCVVVEPRGDRRAALQIGQGGDEDIEQLVIVHLAHVGAVERLELGEVEARRALVDVLDLEPADHVVESS